MSWRYLKDFQDATLGTETPQPGTRIAGVNRKRMDLPLSRHAEMPFTIVYPCRHLSIQIDIRILRIRMWITAKRVDGAGLQLFFSQPPWAKSQEGFSGSPATHLWHWFLGVTLGTCWVKFVTGSMKHMKIDISNLVTKTIILKDYSATQPWKKTLVDLWIISESCILWMVHPNFNLLWHRGHDALRGLAEGNKVVTGSKMGAFIMNIWRIRPLNKGFKFNVISMRD